MIVEVMQAQEEDLLTRRIDKPKEVPISFPHLSPTTSTISFKDNILSDNQSYRFYTKRLPSI